MKERSSSTAWLSAALALAFILPGCSSSDSSSSASSPEQPGAPAEAPATALAEAVGEDASVNQGSEPSETPGTAGDLAEEAVSAAGKAAADAMRSAGEATEEAARAAAGSAREAVDAASAATREAMKAAGEAGSKALEEAQRALEEGKRALEEMTPPPAEQAPPPDEPSVQATDAAAPVTHTVVANITSFDPMVVFAQPGDSITFTNMAGHNTESLDGLIPDGATAWQSQLGENYSVTLVTPGAYVYKCAPHASAGMIAAIVVGEVPPANLAAIESSPENKGMVGRTIRKLRKAIDDHTL